MTFDDEYDMISKVFAIYLWETLFLSFYTQSITDLLPINLLKLQ